jgi:octaprenyl-diphosphate synthase
MPLALTGTPRSQSFLAPVAADLAEVERELGRVFSGQRRHVASLVSHLEHYRGKRLRPALLLLAARACGQVTTEHYTLGAVVEMIHTATLVHDDVLDDADLRRHAKTVNAIWGNHASILLGDMLFSQAFHLASTVDARACSIIGATTNRVCEGELHQVTERGNLFLTEADYFDIIDGKTAELTACCGRLGAIYAGAGADVVDRLTEYGRCLGTAFQIADDLLDVMGTEVTTGKTLGTDLAQGKLTLPVIHLLERLPAADAERIRHKIQNGTLTRDEIRPLLTKTGALAYTRDRADEFAAIARNALSPLPSSEYKRMLETITDWTVRREQ